MSVQPPVAPHRVAMADIDIPFWRMVAIMIKWSLAAIPAFILLAYLSVKFDELAKDPTLGSPERARNPDARPPSAPSRRS